jgi:hypothetical protein
MIRSGITREACRSCGSENLTQLVAEVMIHFSGLRNLDKAGILAFPKIVICLDCGISQFVLHETGLGQLKGNIAA